MKTKKLMLSMAACALMAFAASCSQKSETKADAADAEKAELQQDPQAAPKAEAAVVVLEDDELFRPDKAVAMPTVLDFNATWCVPCKKLAPAFEKAAVDFDGNVAFYSVDIEKCPQTAEAFGVASVPTVVVMKPEGKTTIHVGLDDFATPDQIKDSSAEQLTEIICGNLTDLIK